MQVVGVRVEDTENRLKWKAVIRCGNPLKGMLPLTSFSFSFVWRWVTD